LIGEMVPLVGWIGIVTVGVGVGALARPRGVPGARVTPTRVPGGRVPGERVRERVTVRLALANAVVIAAYSLHDAVGAWLSAAPLTYTLWLFPLTAVPTLLWLHRRAAQRWRTLREARRGLGGAGCAIGSYGLVLLAMTRAPVAPVAALRETSILFGVLLARLMLGERPGRWGWGGALAIAAGAAILRLA
jgi:drug/metabolite transporter (DMT)-like permease